MVYCSCCRQYPALKELLGDDYLDKYDETGTGVIHFFAVGGQINLIRDAVKLKDNEIIEKADQLKHTLLHYAASGRQFKLAKILINEYGIDPNARSFFKQTWMMMLGQCQISDRDALIMSELIMDNETYQKIKDKMQKSENDFDKFIPVRPEFSSLFDLADLNQLSKLIIRVVREIITYSKSDYTEYLSYLLAYQSSNNPITADNAAVNL